MLLNYLGSRIIQNFEAASTGSAGKVLLLNPESYFLKSMKKEDEWGFMCRNKKDRGFRNVFPQEWSTIYGSDSGQFHNSSGMCTFSTVYPLRESWRSRTGSDGAFTPSTGILAGEKYYWKIISFVSHTVLRGDVNKRSRESVYIYIALIAFLTPFFWILARTSERRKQAQNKIKVNRKSCVKRIRNLRDRTKIFSICPYSIT